VVSTAEQQVDGTKHCRGFNKSLLSRTKLALRPFLCLFLRRTLWVLSALLLIHTLFFAGLRNLPGPEPIAEEPVSRAAEERMAGVSARTLGFLQPDMEWKHGRRTQKPRQRHARGRHGLPTPIPTPRGRSARSLHVHELDVDGRPSPSVHLCDNLHVVLVSTIFSLYLEP
jgi:hypothetical protein